jgi:hypothetical protein|tara:strand:+ start:1007 stop:1705 length:699 start_codon:yes stop_codon:yes gene_type:complete
MPILNQGNHKTIKGEQYGWKTYGIHLSPNTVSGYKVCFDATQGCIDACLDTAGRGAMPSVQTARTNKTKRFFEDRTGFMSGLWKEVGSAMRSTARKDLKFCMRPNLTSDLPWESIKHQGKSLMEAFSGYFYDYTKSLSRFTRFLNGELPYNYHLTFSRSEETSDALVKGLCASGGNVAVVFRGHLPDKYLGIDVLNGDDNDLRFLDTTGCIVGLVEKGLAKKDQTGFVVEPV